MAATGFFRRPSPPQRDYTRGGAFTWERTRHDETRTYRVDLSDTLESGETCSSVAINDRAGVTVDSSAVTGAGVLSVTVSEGGDGSLIAMVTTSSSRVLPVPMQWRAAWPAGRSDRYARQW